ncbi:MAG: menaquinone biosynthesis protein [Elusimicrobia bacterium]|nr:menaquinone biosynthesis protein [Elusimicrobiota bacterium]
MMDFRIGELAYTNTLPFRLGAPWNTVACPSPRMLGQWAEAGQIDAGVIPVVEAWRLEDQFEPLEPFGIAVKRQARSVFLFSKRPWDQLNGARIGVTDQTATSAQLFKVLMEFREGFTIQLQVGFSDSDEGRLVIGDDALAPSEALRREFPHVTDLAQEWHAWHKGPFVFARWVVRRTVPRYLREELTDSLNSALTDFDRNRERVAQKAAKTLKLSTQQLIDYFDGFVYRLGEPENQSESLFRDFVSGRTKRVCC